MILLPPARRYSRLVIGSASLALLSFPPLALSSSITRQTGYPTPLPEPPRVSPETKNQDLDLATGTCIAGNGTCSASSLHLGTMQGDSRNSKMPLPGECWRPVVASLAPVTSIATAAPSNSSTCQPETGWLTRGLWIGGADKFALLDADRHSVLFYNSSGKADGFLDHFGSVALRENLLTGLLPTDTGYLALIRGKKLMWLDPSFQPRSEEALTDRGIAAFYEWDATENQLVAYGALAPDKPGDRPRLGFLDARLERDSSGEIALSQPTLFFPLQDNRAYLLGHKNIASARGRLFFLAVEKEAAIYEATNPPRRVQAFPSEYRPTAPLPGPTSRTDEAVAVYSALEEWTGPAGLYSDGDLLYLLTRRPDTPSGVRWELHPIDPDSGKLFAARALPTEAPHLLVVPGPQVWLVVEKGSVVSWGQQPIRSVLRLRISELRGDHGSRQEVAAGRSRVCQGEFVRSPS